MNQRFSVKLGAGLTVGTVVGFGIVGAAGYLAMKVSPSKKEEKEESKDVTDNTESAN